MIKKLELEVSLKPHKSKEFRQSLKNLSKRLGYLGTDFLVEESKDAQTFSILFRWESDSHMHQELASETFKILSGGINSLCEKTIIRLDDKHVSNHISILKI